jgi:hypothetical protein
MTSFFLLGSLPSSIVTFSCRRHDNMSLFKHLFLLGLVSNAIVVHCLQVFINVPDDEIASIEGNLPVTVDGLSPAPDCSFPDGDFTIEWGGQQVTYRVEETQPRFWYGEEQGVVDGVSSFGFVRVASNRAVFNICYLTGFFRSSSAGLTIAFNTHADGSIWASFVTPENSQIEDDEIFPSIPSLPSEPSIESDDGSIIDILVVTSSEFECLLSDADIPGNPSCTRTPATLAAVENFIDTQVAYLNQILINSQISLVINRVGPTRFNQGTFTEAAGFSISNILSQVEACTPNSETGFFGSSGASSICALRTTHCADLVHLVLSGPTRMSNSFSGSGFASIGPDAGGFGGVTNSNTQVLPGIFAHEIGHNLVSLPHP